MSNKEENKNYVTPYAFGVDDSLLGKALASPSRRLFSMIIDILVVGSLTLMSTTVMASSILAVSIIGSIKASRKRARDGVSSLAPKFLGITAVLSAAFIISGVVFSDVDLGFGAAEPENVAVESTKDARIESAVDSSEEKPTLITWAQSVTTDLGLGFGWAAIYFSVFTAWFGGQTLGKMLFRIQVAKIDGDEISLWESFGRYGGYSAGLATGLLGFLQVIWDANRQAIHDKVSETVVLDLRKPNKEC
jgi:uncharacterized RDD family membrane protein YckC